jgi:hypothetical protein
MAPLLEEEEEDRPDERIGRIEGEGRRKRKGKQNRGPPSIERSTDGRMDPYL